MSRLWEPEKPRKGTLKPQTVFLQPQAPTPQANRARLKPAQPQDQPEPEQSDDSDPGSDQESPSPEPSPSEPADHFGPPSRDPVRIKYVSTQQRSKTLAPDVSDDEQPPKPEPVYTRKQTVERMGKLDPRHAFGHRLTGSVRFSPRLFYSTILVPEEDYDPQSYASVRKWACSLINLESKALAGNSALEIAAYISGCWVDSSDEIPSDIAIQTWEEARIKISVGRVSHDVREMEADMAQSLKRSKGSGNTYDDFKETSKHRRAEAEDPDPTNWAESITALLKQARESPRECEAVSRAFLVISLVVVQAASREISRLSAYMSKSLPGICVQCAGLSQLPMFVVTDELETNLKVVFRPETPALKSIVLITVACANFRGELKKIHETGAALRLAFYGMPIVALSSSSAKWLGVKLGSLWASVMGSKTEHSITALTNFLHNYGDDLGNRGLNLLAPYARLFATGVFQELSTADNGYFVAIMKTIIKEAGPKSEADAIGFLEGVKISDFDLRWAQQVGISAVDIVREEALTEKNVGAAIERARIPVDQRPPRPEAPQPLPDPVHSTDGPAKITTTFRKKVRAHPAPNPWD